MLKCCKYQAAIPVDCLAAANIIKTDPARGGGGAPIMPPQQILQKASPARGLALSITIRFGIFTKLAQR